MYSKQEQLDLYVFFRPSLLNLRFYDGGWSAKTEQPYQVWQSDSEGIIFKIFNAIS